MTPESKVKAQVDKVLKNAIGTYYNKPVQNGMGTPTLDYHGCSQGRYFAIETKAYGEKLTKRQTITMNEIVRAGGTVFVICGGDPDNLTSVGMNELILFLAR